MYSVDGRVHGENHCFQTDATAFARDTLCLAGASRRRWSFDVKLVTNGMVSILYQFGSIPQFDII